jgi:hypothetical protein
MRDWTRTWTLVFPFAAFVKGCGGPSTTTPTRWSPGVTLAGTVRVNGTIVRLCGVSDIDGAPESIQELIPPGVSA